MLKNIRIGVKLIVVGTLIMVIPLLVVAFMAISKSTQGLSNVENEQLKERSSDIAQMIDRVFQEEQKMAMVLSIDPDIVAAARALAEKPAAAEPSEQPGKAGRNTRGGQGGSGRRQGSRRLRAGSNGECPFGDYRKDKGLVRTTWRSSARVSTAIPSPLRTPRSWASTPATASISKPPWQAPRISARRA